MWNAQSIMSHFYQIAKLVAAFAIINIFFPERLLLQCPTLKNVHAFGCQDMSIGAIRTPGGYVVDGV